MPAWASVQRGVIAGGCGRKVQAELIRPTNDLRLRHRDQRGVDPERETAFDTRLRSEVGGSLERFEELRPAVGISRVVEGIRADEDVSGADRFAPGHRVREEE